jgi:flagellin
MSSILTNNGAMVALQTMRQINRGMESVQDQISTGLKVGSAKGNAATWAISKVMESDVTGFRAIRENIALGSSTVNVARNAAETTTKLLTEIKEKIVQAQEDNVDRGKIQEDINQLRGQIETVINSAQFNGLSLVNGSEREQVLSSLDRSAAGVNPNSISVLKQDLTMREAVFGTAPARAEQPALTVPGTTGAAATQAVTVSAAGTAGTENSLTINGVTVNYLSGADTNATATNLNAAIAASTELADIGITAAVATNVVTFSFNGEARVEGVTFAAGTGAGTATLTGTAPFAAAGAEIEIGAGAMQGGDSFRVTIDGEDYEFVANSRSTAADALSSLAEQINAGGAAYATVRDGSLFVAQNSGAGLTMTGTRASGGQAAGGLQALNNIDVADFSSVLTPGMSAEDQRAAIRTSLEGALGDIESLIQTSIDAASEFGSVQKRLEIQSDFVGNLMDSLRSGIGALVDADMEEASARLQALQVQQQLGIQALTIANQQPQNILALFR